MPECYMNELKVYRQIWNEKRSTEVLYGAAEKMNIFFTENLANLFTQGHPRIAEQIS